MRKQSSPTQTASTIISNLGQQPHKALTTIANVLTGQFHESTYAHFQYKHACNSNRHHTARSCRPHILWVIPCTSALLRTIVSAFTTFITYCMSDTTNHDRQYYPPHNPSHPPTPPNAIQLDFDQKPNRIQQFIPSHPPYAPYEPSQSTHTPQFRPQQQKRQRHSAR